MYLLQLMDNYAGGMTLIIIGFFEIVALVWVYGEEILPFHATKAKN
jgi:hypothetical protein